MAFFLLFFVSLSTAATVTYSGDLNTIATVKQGAQTVATLTLLNQLHSNGTDLILDDCGIFECMVKLNLRLPQAFTVNGDKPTGHAIGTAKYEDTFLWAETTISEPKYSQNCSIQSIFANSSWLNATICDTYQNGTSSYSKYEWKPLNNRFTFAKNTDYIIGIKYSRSNMSLSDLVPDAFSVSFSEWAWWNTSYNKKILATVQNFTCGKPYCQFPFNITLDYNKTNGTDMAIVNSAENAIIPYWRETNGWNYTTATGRIWINATNNTSAFYIYYNSTAQDLSNGDSVFLFFDDFEGSAINTSKWTIVNNGGTTNVANGVFTHTGNPYFDMYSNDTGYPLVNLGYSAVIRYKNPTIGGGTAGSGMGIANTPTTEQLTFDSNVANQFYWYIRSDARGASLSPSAPNSSNWVVRRLERNLSTCANVYQNSLSIPNYSTCGKAVSTTDFRRYFWSYNGANNSIDWWAIGAYTGSASATYGEEEQNSGVSFISQSPSNFSSLTLNANVSYSITGQTGNETLWYKSNNSNSDVSIWVNGTGISGWQSSTAFSNVSTTYNWSLNDNQLLPATYNKLPENGGTTTFALNALTQGVKQQLLNVSPSSPYGFYESAINGSAGETVHIVYCNSTYTTGNFKTDTNCAEFGNYLANSAPDHKHGTISHYVLPFFSNGTRLAGTSVEITPTSYFIAWASGGSTAYFENNASRAGATQTTGSNGVVWADSNEVYHHLHQYQNTTQFCHFASATISGTQTNSTVSCDTLELTALAPLPPSITAPTDNQSFLLNSSIWVNYTSATAQAGSQITYYNITLLNSDGSANLTIRGNNSLNLTYLWNSTGTTAGTYRIRVTAYTNTSTNAFDQHTINIYVNTPPTTPTLVSPPNGGGIGGLFVSLVWANSTDANGDSLTYDVCVDTNANPVTCSTQDNPYNFTGVAYTTHFWKVRAFDGLDYSNYSSIWNFTFSAESVAMQYNSTWALPDGWFSSNGGYYTWYDVQFNNNVSGANCSMIAYASGGSPSYSQTNTTVNFDNATVYFSITGMAKNRTYFTYGECFTIGGVKANTSIRSFYLIDVPTTPGTTTEASLIWFIVFGVILIYVSLRWGNE